MVHKDDPEKRVHVPIAPRLSDRTVRDIIAAAGVSRSEYIWAWQRKPGRVPCPEDHLYAAG
jgi:hypothetical protein